MTMKKVPTAAPAKRGGTRPGAGRKPVDGVVADTMFMLRLPADMRDKLNLLGGSAWVRAKIKAAKLPDSKKET